MRKTDRLANEMFDGDTKKAIEYVVKNSTNEKLKILTDEWTKEERRTAFEVIKKIAEEKVGKKKIKSEIRLAVWLDNLNLTEEEVLAMKKNPYMKTMIMYLSALIIAVFIPILIVKILNVFNIDALWLYELQGVLIGYIAFAIGMVLIKMFKFRWVTKYLLKREKIENNDGI